VDERPIFAQADVHGKVVRRSVARIVLFSACSPPSRAGGAKIPGVPDRVIDPPPFVVVCALQTERRS